MLTLEQEEIARTVRRIAPDRAAARVCAEGGPAVDRALWGQLAELGVVGLSLPERLGGSGLGLAEETLVAEVLSGAVAPVPVIPAFLAARILAAADGPTAEALARRLVSGATIVGALLLAEGGLHPTITVEGAGDKAKLTGNLIDVFEGAALDVLLIFAAGRWWAVETTGEGMIRAEVSTLDSTRRMADIEFSAAPGQAVGSLAPELVLTTARTLIAAEAVGVGQAALDMAREYSLERKQFGQPIGRFQAIKQKLADSLVAVEGGRSAVWGAVRTAGQGFPDPTAARLAKSEATSAARLATAEAVQTHGAMGVTWEHDLHLLMRRAKHVELSLGAPDQHLRAIGDTLIETTVARGGKAERANLDLGFIPSPEDEAFIAPFRAWLDANISPERAKALKRANLAARREWQAQMAETGWIGIHWPKAYGGRDATFTQQILYYAELTKRRLPALPGNRGLMLVGPTLIAHGNAVQKALVEPTRRCDIFWCGGFSERGSGSDLASLRTKGVIDGDELVITGHKIWTSQAHLADWMYALIRTGPLVPKHDGISVVLIPMNTPGVEVRPIQRNNGDFHFNEVFFDEARVPLANIVGPLNEGWRVNRTTMIGEHLTNFLGAQAAQANTNARLIEALVAREARLGVDPDLRHRLAKGWAITQVVKLHGLRNIARFTGGENPGAEGSIQKLVGQEHEKRLYELMIDIRGVQGLRSSIWTSAYLSTRASTIGGGTSEIHRNKLAERVLGMPRDLWADEDQTALETS